MSMQITHPQNVFKKREKVNMSDDLIERLRGYGDGNNDLMDAAADRIEKLEAEVESLQNIRHYGLRHIMRVQEGELPKDEVYGLPLFAEKNKVYPWPAENVELYAYWKRTDK